MDMKPQLQSLIAEYLLCSDHPATLETFVEESKAKGNVVEFKTGHNDSKRQEISVKLFVCYALNSTE